MLILLQLSGQKRFALSGVVVTLGRDAAAPQQFLCVEIDCAAKLGVGSFALSQLAWKFGKFGLPGYGTIEMLSVAAPSARA